MTKEEIQTLIASGESFDVEFKGEEKRPLSDGDLVEAVVCLANRSGERAGYLFVGVEDNGRVTGSRPRQEAGITDPIRVQAMISGRTRPALSVSVTRVTLDDKEVLIIEVPPVRQPVGTTDGKYLRRALGGDGKPACLPFHFHEMQSLQSSRGLLDYSAAVVPGASWTDLDPLEFERFRRSIRESEGRGDQALLKLSDLELAKVLGAVSSSDPLPVLRVLALLLFGREESLARYLPAHEAAFQQLQGQKVEVNDFARWPLLRVMDEFSSRFRARLEEEEILVDMVRVGIPNYPSAALREALANALIHRDYTRLGAVHVQWQVDRVEVGSPGGFPEGVRLDNLLVTQPRPRNPLLADAFKRAGLVERTARGIDMMYHALLRCGRQPPSYARSQETNVVVVMPGGKPDLDFARFVAEETGQGRDLGLDDLMVLRALADQGRLTLPEIAKLVQKSEEEAAIIVRLLIEAGYSRDSNRKGLISIFLSPALSKRFSRTIPVGSPELDDSQDMENKILDHLRKHGSISRGECSRLCDISTDQAFRLLQHLTQKGVAVMVNGKTKGARYQLLR